MEATQLAQKANLHKDQGNKFFTSGQYQEALDCYTKAILLDPIQPVFHSNASQCLIYLKQYQKAADAASKALDLDPNHVKSLVRRSAAFQALSQLQPALADLKRASELDPTNKNLMNNLSTLLASVQLQEKPSKESATSSKPTVPSSSSSTPSPSFKNSKSIALETARVELASVVPDLPQSPSTFGEFEVHWRSLQDHETLLHQFMCSIDPTQVPIMFKDLMTGDILYTFLRTIDTLVEANPGDQLAVQLLQTISRLPRFPLLKMFLTGEQRKATTSIFQKLDASACGLSTTEYEKLKGQYA
jgi:tetratricopeptide (TPR) repeat protein